ncbi:uncharacterized protein ACRADG_000746 isoform 2-T2 [Cochliomyia hominivorax]
MCSCVVILKDVSYNIMCELLEFMYQGVVNVKHTELQSFMKIGQLLQIKGLATNSTSSAASMTSEKSFNNNQSKTISDDVPFTSKTLNSSAMETVSHNSNNDCEIPSENNSNANTPQRLQTPLLSPATSPINNSSNTGTVSTEKKLIDSQPSMHQSSKNESSSVSGIKRYSDYSTDSLSIYSRNKQRRSLTSTEHSSDHTEESDRGNVSGGMEQMNTEDFFLPHISMVESRFEINNIKRENSEHNQINNSAGTGASASLRNSFNTAAFGLDYTFYKNNSSSQTGQEYPNELHMSNEYTKSFANHMDIPPNCPNVVMLSSTSLLHGNCVFNRNNTVATQQGMKTYWLCKSYRISMCRARCITHQGKIISATGVHNHPPHMRPNSTGNNCNSGSNANVNSGNTGGSSANNTISTSTTHSSGVGLPAPSSSLRFPQNSGPSATINQQNVHENHHSPTPPSQVPPSGTFLGNHHLNSSNTNNTNCHPSSHLFLQSMPNLLVQHYPSGQAVQQATISAQHHNLLHNYEMSTAILSSPSNEHSRNENSSFDPNAKSHDTINKDQLNEEHIPMHNSTTLSPVAIQNTNIKTGHVDALTDNNEVEKEIRSSGHHQVQVIDSITISPGSGHNFKMESM